MHDLATLKLKPRPLRLVYLASNRADLINAVTLYTHLWGGFANSIFPVPNDKELALLEYALHSINPDYIFLPEEELPDNVTELLNQFPSASLKLSSNQIENIANYKNEGYPPLRFENFNSFSRAELPHIFRVLNFVFKNKLSDSNICCASDNFDESFLQFGKPSDLYQRYLINDLNGKLISINSIEAFLKMSLLAAFGMLKTPVSLSQIKATYSQKSLVDFGIEDITEVFNLFLYESGDINVAASFWNSRQLDINYSNKLILSKHHFVNNLRKVVAILSNFFPSMRVLTIYATLSEEEAKALAEKVKTVFNDFKRNIFVKIYYRGFAFNFRRGNIYSIGKPIVTTRTIYSLDRSIRFSPIVPSGYENSKCLVGYDAEVEFSSGKTLSAPLMPSSAALLSKSIKSVQYLESNQSFEPTNWQDRKTLSVRPAEKGITGLAVSNGECRIYFPDSKEILARWLKRLGINLKLNDRTRYAEGFIKRFGGFEKTASLVNSGGTKIFVVLNEGGAKQCGYKYSEILSGMNKKFSLKSGDTKKIVQRNLLRLLETGLIYRGFPLECPSCGLQDWYKLDKADEFVECAGCAENIQLKNLEKLEFAYKPNELAARFFSTDGPALLSTAVFLSKLNPSRHIQLGGELLRLSEKQLLAEIDIFIFIKNILIVAECKSRREVDEKKAKEIIEDLNKKIETAVEIKAKVVVLGIVTASPVKFDLHSLVADVAAESAIKKGIGVHLLLNDRLYLWGKQGVTNAWPVSVEELLVEEFLPYYPPVSAGEAVTEYKQLQADKLVNQDLLQSWQQELYGHLNFEES